jgi:hypothetical protein
MTDSWEEVSKQFDRKDKEMQRRILARPGSQRYLKALVKAGASEARVLSMLSFAVIETGSWQEPMRRKERELERIANDLETVAKHAQRVSLDPTSYLTLWMAMLSIGNWENVKPASERSPARMFELMRAYAKNCRDRAKAFGSLRRTHSLTEKRQIVDCVLLEVWRSTGKYYDKQLARLLTNAFEAAGRKQHFTEDQIKKHRQRSVIPRIEAYQLSHPVTSAPELQKGTVRTRPAITR